ncbi:MAG: hypothetical protein QOD51_2623, partial [Candidatus Eremiobacteraeota bacterium]|nr:hypothetical protein [Candidatus Eremiobacteraeota bacterium]
WDLRIYAPGSRGSATPEETISGTGYPQQVTLGVDGINVLWSAAKPGTGGLSTLSTYVYGAGNNPQPVRTFALGNDVTDVAIDTNDRIYVARSAGGGISVYPPRSTCTCSALRTIATRLQVQRSLAVAKDGTVYVLTRDAAAETSYVNVYAPGNDGSTPSRKFGPFYENADVAPPNFGWDVGNPTGGIALDAAGDLYVGFADGAGNVRVNVYGLDQYGLNSARGIATPTFSTYLTSIAIGPAPAGPAVAPTLYVASRSQVLAFAADASGTATPQRKLGGFWKTPPDAGPDHWKSASFGAMTTADDGTLTVLVNSVYSSSSWSCSLIVFAANANGGAQRSGPDCGLSGHSAARGPDGETDFVIIDWSLKPSVHRFVNGVLSAQINSGAASIAVTPNDTLYATIGQGRIAKYPPNSSGGTIPDTFTLAGNLGAMCAAPDGTLYVATNIPATSGAPGPDYVYAVPSGGTAPARTLGPFADSIAALACDAQNELYVGLNLAGQSGSKVSVYAPNAAGAAAPLQTLLNPIPPNDPAGQTISALAVSP